jgi:hypothetical protein
LLLLFANNVLLLQWGKEWDKKAPIKLCDKALNEQKEFPEQEVKTTMRFQQKKKRF